MNDVAVTVLVSLLNVFWSGGEYQRCRPALKLWPLYEIPQSHAWEKTNGRVVDAAFHSRR